LSDIVEDQQVVIENLRSKLDEIRKIFEGLNMFTSTEDDKDKALGDIREAVGW
jgi:hypothetical protein